MRRVCAVIFGVLAIALIASTGCTRSCSTSNDCGTGSECVYKIGDCSAQGECHDIPDPSCGFVSELCRCTGGVATTGCGYPDGYASGPTTGEGYYGYGSGICGAQVVAPAPTGGICGVGSCEANDAGDAAVDQ